MKQSFLRHTRPWAKVTALGVSLILTPWNQAMAQTTASDQDKPITSEALADKTYPPVQVVDTPLEYRQFERVEITGSAILAKEAKQALPLQIIDRREIERSGATNLVELIQRLPVMSNFSELGSVTGTLSGGPETAAIHGNQSGTLVLLNGRRLPYYGSQTIVGERAVVDLNFVPLVAVEKIEILTDGASSRYGSDAVAGVINIITKSEQQGVGIQVGGTLPQGGHGLNQSVNLSWGKGRLQRDGYNLRAYFVAETTEAVLAKHREVSSQGARSLQIDGNTWWQKANYGQYSAPAKNYRDAQGVLRNDYFLRTGQCETGWYELYRGECDKNTQGNMTLYPKTDKQLLYVQGDKVLNNRWVLFAEGLVGRYDQITVPNGSYWSKDVPNEDGSRQYLLDIVPLQLVKQKYANRIHNAVLGLRGEQSGWDFVTSVSSGKHHVVRSYTEGLLLSRLTTLSLPPEVIGQEPAQYSAANLSAIEPYRRTEKRVMDTGWTQLDSFNFLASREWMETENGPVGVGVGLDVRREAVFYEAPVYNNASEAYQRSYRPNFDARRSNWATHLEITAPVGPDSEITAALRHDQYSDFGSVQTGKAGWKWKPHRSWLFRGSLGTGFRAPSLGQLLPNKTKIYDTFDYVTNDWLAVANQGNPLLKPERSMQTTWGMRFEPDQRLTMGADLWQLNIQDIFGVLSVRQILDNPENRLRYVVDGEILQPNQNLGKSIQRGLDYDVQIRQPTDIGRLRVTLRGTHMLKSVNQDAVTGAMLSNVARSGDGWTTTVARNQWTLSSQLERADWTGGASLHYRSGEQEKTVLIDADGQQLDYTGRVPGYWTLDVASRWQIKPQWQLSASVVNLTNRLPPLRMAMQVNVLLGVDTRYANYLGRNLRVKMDYKF
ncbi:TonB-dependent siderophore receptor [Limnohabitans sp. 2KL-1]|uniref:TonB-dependent receptor plug domain-containing protein n=1 Tax=Limnohabitans sp. 2KL-1 TaxID=1100699 RepID=UPI001304A660|nr:TonB-dependent receptor [Limnohabitans sp. 2KL-1]